ncbi:hypothetical protein GCM10027074_63800 [Streptomyces deserti]
MFRAGSRRTHDTGPAAEALRLVKVSKTYGTADSAVTALDGVTLGLGRGTFTAVMGPSGSGKSTLLQCAAGLDRPDSGIVRVDGTELTGGGEAELTKFRRGRIGFVFQQYNLLETLTVAQNTVLPLNLAGRRVDRERVREVLTAVGLGDRLGHRPDQLSGGQRQRVAIARALVTEPRGQGRSARPAGGRPRRERPGADGTVGRGGGRRLRGVYGSSPASDGWSSHQTLDRLRPQTLLARVRDDIRARDGAAGFADRLLEDEIRRRIEVFRRMVGAEARRRVAERRGRDEIARRAVAPSPDRVDFLFAGRDQLAELRRTVQPLARKLATRLAARRRRAARGAIDLRRTLRGSLSTGGVPMRPVLRRRRPARPELVLLCDVSGSVSGFSDFTMLLVQALHDQFSKVRVFAFVNRIDEVTRLLVHGAADPEGLGARIRRRRR